jgi:transmembrane protein 222
LSRVFETGAFGRFDAEGAQCSDMTQAVELRVDSSNLPTSLTTKNKKKSYTDRGNSGTAVPRKSSTLLLGAAPSAGSLLVEEMSALHIDNDYDGSHDNNDEDHANVNATASRSGKKDRHHEDLSYAIVWSPLPIITWIIPFVGHTGICDSHGIASDFQGPYYVGDVGRMAFGAPTRALLIINSGQVAAEEWDAAIRTANDVYRGRMHNICCDNCHSHVAYALNSMGAQAYGITKWDMVKIAMLMFFRGRFLSWSAILHQFLPFTLLVVTWLALRRL